MLYEGTGAVPTKNSPRNADLVSGPTRYLDRFIRFCRAHYDGNPANDVIDFRSVSEARCELRPVAMFVFTGSAATAA